jgi:inner membrane protein
MNPVTHILLSWDAASLLPLDRRERVAVVLVGVLPDVDAAGWFVRLVTAGEGPAGFFLAFHHVAGHNLFFGSATAAAAAFFGRRRPVRPARLLACAALGIGLFHLHLLCDLLGSRGPDGYDWPISYLWPATSLVELHWSGQWALNAWPNLAITLAALALAFGVAVRKGVSPAEFLSDRWNRDVVRALGGWWERAVAACGGSKAGSSHNAL